MTQLAPTTSAQQSQLFWQACERYTVEHGPKFNLGKTKSAILAIDIPAEEELDLANCRYMQLQVPVVQHYTYMGITFDATLSMDSHLASTLARMNSRFEEHMACGINAGLPTPLLAAITDQGPEAVGFYGLALCIGAAGAESKLNAMQANWCREVLGCQASHKGRISPCLPNVGLRGVLARECLVQHSCSKLVFGLLMTKAQLVSYCLQPEMSPATIGSTMSVKFVFV